MQSTLSDWVPCPSSLDSFSCSVWCLTKDTKPFCKRETLLFSLCFVVALGYNRVELSALACPIFFHNLVLVIHNIFAVKKPQFSGKACDAMGLKEEVI